VAELDSPGALEVDSVNGTLGVVTTAKLLQVAQTALAALTAQTLLSQVLAAGALNVKGRTLLVTGYVVFTSAAATPTLTIALLLGATTLATITTAALAGSQTNAQLQFQFQLSVASIGATGSIEAHGAVAVQLAAALGTALAEYADQVTAAVGSLNLTAAQTLSVTIAASSTITSATLRLASVEVVA
jgi:hypothetical protein